jgi:hypothetical protein
MTRSSKQGRECGRWEERLQRLAIGDLPRRARGRVARHLLACGDCRDYLRRARRYSGVLAESGRVDVPQDLAEQIKTACLLSTLMQPAQRPAYGRFSVSFAGVTAAAVVLVAVLSYSYRPAQMALLSSAGPRAAATIAEPASAEAPIAVRPAAPVARPGAALEASAEDVNGPRIVLASTYRYGEASSRRAAAVVIVDKRAGVAAAAPRTSRTRFARGAIVSGLGGPNPASIAALARGRAASGDGAAAKDDGADGDVNGDVATQVAAGVVAGAVIEKYLASALASRGAQMAADAADDEAASTADAVWDDESATGWE